MRLSREKGKRCYYYYFFSFIIIVGDLLLLTPFELKLADEAILGFFSKVNLTVANCLFSLDFLDSRFEINSDMEERVLPNRISHWVKNPPVNV